MRTLVLCIDIDNDLFEKAKVRGPVVGLENVKAAAIKMAIADPEEPDANAMFAAVQIYSELKKGGREVEIAVLTGHKNLGYSANQLIKKQLDMIVYDFKPESAIVVGDGVGDEEVLPMINTVVKVEAVKNIVMKQAKELEKTYFVLLEKLKDPYYARLLLGVPALFILVVSAITLLNLPWQYVGIIVGFYLLLKGFGIDELIGSSLKSFKFSVERPGWIAGGASLLLFIISLWMGMQAIHSDDRVKEIGEFVLGAMIIMPWAAFLFIIGGVVDALIEKNRSYKIATYGMYTIGIIAIYFVINWFARWITNESEPYIGFSDLVIGIIAVGIVTAVGISVVKGLRTEALLKMSIVGKEVIDQNGMLIGSAVGIDPKKERIVIKSTTGTNIEISLDRIREVGEGLIISMG
ncbi:MAG: DUF373 family protein [Candidatus Anstonellales archaeon]